MMADPSPSRAGRTGKKKSAARPACPNCGKKQVRKVSEKDFDRIWHALYTHRLVLARQSAADFPAALLCPACGWCDLHGQEFLDNDQPLPLRYASGTYRAVGRSL